MDKILEPSVIPQADPVEESTCLLHDNYLSEFVNEDEKSIARDNLGVYGQESVFTKDESKTLVNERLKAALANYVPSTELNEAINKLGKEIEEAGFVRADGSIPFDNPQSQLAFPTEEFHLANKAYVDNILASHVKASDPHNILQKVKDVLVGYTKKTDTYAASELYTKADIVKLLTNYIRKDGQTPFDKPQIGKDPTLPSHLATARYVDSVMSNHNTELDPHSFMETLRRCLSNYYTKSETYTKAQTYSRAQLLEIIKGQMKGIVEQAIAAHVSQDGSVSELKDEVLKALFEYAKLDGTTPFTAPQQGIAASKADELVILSQLTEAIENLDKTLNENIKKATNQTTWIPSGPVRTTVGFVEDNMRMPREMTVQQVCDAIFYGRQIGVAAPPFAEYGEKVCIKIFTHGIGILEEVEIFKNNELIGTLTAEDFRLSPEDFRDDGAFYEYCETGDFTADAEWKVVFHYSDGQVITDTATTKLSYPIFIGAIPYWWNAHEDITIENLRTLTVEDPINCRFFTHHGPEINRLKAKFSFTDARQRSLVVVIPNSYPDLLRIITPTQEVEAGAFAKWLQPMYPNNVETGVLYKIYVFNQPLVKLDQVIKFHFGTQNEDYYE